MFVGNKKKHNFSSFKKTNQMKQKKQKVVRKNKPPISKKSRNERQVVALQKLWDRL